MTPPTGRLALALLAVLAPGAAWAQTQIKLDIDLRQGRPTITRYRRVRRYGWHSGLHYAPYTDKMTGERRVGWHRGFHRDWYVIDVPVLHNVDRDGWDVFVRFGKGKHLRARGDLDTTVRRTTTIGAPGADLLAWVRPDGTVIGGAAAGRKRVVVAGSDGWMLGDSVFMVDVPQSRGVEIYLKRRTKDLDKGEKPETPEDAAKLRAELEATRKRDRLLDAGDKEFALARYPQAALLYQKAIKLDRTDALARFAVAHALFALGVYETAGKNVRLALDEFPEWGEVDLELPAFYQNKALLANQLAKLKAHVAKHPRDDDARLLWGYCLYFSGDRKAGLAQFKRLVALPGVDKHATMFLQVAADARQPDLHH